MEIAVFAFMALVMMMILGIFGALVYAVAIRPARRGNRLRDVAQRKGWTYAATEQSGAAQLADAFIGLDAPRTYHVMRGLHDGMRAVCYELATHRPGTRAGRKRGTNRTLQAICSLELPRPVPDLAVVEQSRFERLRKAVGGEDIATGDPAFDERFRVTSSDTTFALAVLKPEARAALLALPSLAVRTREAAVVCWADGELTAERVEEQLAVASTFARAVRRGTGEAVTVG